MTDRRRKPKHGVRRSAGPQKKTAAPQLDRMTLRASRKVLHAVRHAAIDYGVSEGALVEAGARLLLALPAKRVRQVLERFGASRRRRPLAKGRR